MIKQNQFLGIKKSLVADGEVESSKLTNVIIWDLTFCQILRLYSNIIKVGFLWEKNLSNLKNKDSSKQKIIFESAFHRFSEKLLTAKVFLMAICSYDTCLQFYEKIFLNKISVACENPEVAN